MKHGKPADVFLIGFLLIAAIGSLLFLRFSPGELIAVVYQNGNIAEEINLSRVTEPYLLDMGQTVLSVEPGRICFVQAHCEDRLCIKHGWLSKSGETMACVPAKTVISLKSQENGPDAVTGEKR